MIRAVRTDLGGAASATGGTVVASLVHLSDLHVLDAASPARGEWVELEAADPLFRPLLHMHRPYDALTTFALHAHVEAIRRDPVGAGGRPYDLAVSTGDNIDNAQRNELDAYLSIIAGGVARLDARGCAQDSSSGVFAGVWPYWCPDARVDDSWRALGYPEVDDFIPRASAPIVSAGIGIPWTSVPGNHDLLRQGTALDNAAIASIAVGATKSLRRPADFSPSDPLNLYLDEPEAFSTGHGFTIEPDANRRAIDRREWLEAHVGAGALGFTDAQTGIDTVIDLEHVRLVLLDTNHPDGDFEGSLGAEQVAWLDERLSETDAEPGRLALLVSHHGVPSLVNDRGHRAGRLLAADIEAFVHRHPSVVAWLLGHRHVNRIDPRAGPAGGYWEITTSSTIDWPSQARGLDVIRQSDGSVELMCTMLDHHDGPGGLASLHRDLAKRFTTTGAATRMAGRPTDGSVRLVLPAP